MSELARDEHWQRLDPRMMLVHPVRELLRFLPVLVGVFIAGSAAGNRSQPWQLLAIGVPVGLGMLRYLTTSFRVAAGRVELRRGVLNKHVLSTPVDRVRTVDLTASPIHRVLGLTTVRVGTGTASTDGDDRLDLDGLPVARARRLREELLHADPQGPAADGTDGADREQVVLRFDLSWVRFAPLTSSGLVISAGVLGAGTQLLSELGGLESLDPRQVVDGTGAITPWVAVPFAVVLGLVLVSGLAVAGYLVTNWGFTLAHVRSTSTWQLRRGLFTTRETSLDDERLSGVTLVEPIGLRLARGGRLSAIVTGLDARQQGSSTLVPPAPWSVVTATASQVLGTAAPVLGRLVGHGVAARNRRFSRALVPALVVSLVALLAVVLGDASRWLLPLVPLAPLVGFALAADRARSLGHALADGHLVARSGSLTRHRSALSTDDVIGWNFRATWFQRRAGLTTLVATTAGGPQSVTVLDVPESAATALACVAVPRLVDQFTETPETSGP